MCNVFTITFVIDFVKYDVFILVQYFKRQSFLSIFICFYLLLFFFYV